MANQPPRLSADGLAAQPTHFQGRLAPLRRRDPPQLMPGRVVIEPLGFGCYSRHSDLQLPLEISYSQECLICPELRTPASSLHPGVSQESPCSKQLPSANARCPPHSQSKGRPGTKTNERKSKGSGMKFLIDHVKCFSSILLCHSVKSKIA